MGYSISHISHLGEGILDVEIASKLARELFTKARLTLYTANYQLKSHMESDNHSLSQSCECCINWFCFDPSPLILFRQVNHTGFFSSVECTLSPG